MKYDLNQMETQLMVIDFQEKLVPIMTESEVTVKNAITLIKMAKALEIPITITEQYPKGIGHTILEISEELEGFSIFEKDSFSSFTPEIEKHISKNNKKKIIISGIETHICVFQTVRDLVKNGYEVYVVSDAVSSRTKANRENGLSLMKDIGAIITNTETVLFDLLKVSTHPKFRELSKLIK